MWNSSVNEGESSTHLLSGWRFKAMLATLIIAVLAYFLMTLWGGWKEVLYACSKVGILGILAALALSLVNYFIRFLRWTKYLHLLGHTLPFWQNLKIYMSGFALTTTPGKTGEALRSIFLKDYGIAYRQSFGVFLSERLSDLLAVLFISAFGLWIYPEARLLTVATALIIAFLLYAVQQDKWLLWTEKKLKSGRLAGPAEFTIEALLSFRVAFRPKALLVGTFLGVIAWAAEGLAFYFLLQLMGIEISFLSAQFIYAFSLLIGAITLLPGGLGGVEVTMIQLLLLEGVSSADAAALTLLIRLTTLWFSVLLGLLALPQKKVHIV